MRETHALSTTAIATHRDPNGGRTPPVILVQVVRGLAALLVLIGHVQGAVVRSASEIGQNAVIIPNFSGGFGVDLFFTISGFIMVVSSRQFFNTEAGWRRFLVRRMIRLVPLYWFFTLLYLPMLLLGNTGFQGNLPVSIATSLTFIPYAMNLAGQGGVFPIYNLGWSLNYEMFFYVVFSAFLFLPRRGAILGSLAALACFVAGGLIFQPVSDVLTVWTAPIMLEFGFGLVIGAVWLGPSRLPAWACWGLLLAALSFLLLDPAGLGIKTETGTTPNDLHRVFGFGLPAAAILVAVTFLEKGRRLPTSAPLAWFRRLGDVSYSLYLVHPIVILVVIKVWSVLVGRGVPGMRMFATWPGMGVVLITAAIIAAFVTNALIEKPVTRWLNGHLKP